MKKLIFVLLFGLALQGVANAGPHHRGDLLSAAKTLDRTANRFRKTAHYEGTYRLSERARSFARASARFCEHVAHGYNRRVLWDDYERLNRRFNRLSRSFDYGHGDPYLRKDFNRMARAFSRVSYQLRADQRYAQRYYDNHQRFSRVKPRSRSRSGYAW